MEKVLITGTAGFIGHHLALAMNKKGYNVTGLDTINDYYDITLKFARLKEQGIDQKDIEYNKPVHGKNGIDFIRLNLEDDQNLQQLFQKHQFVKVVHLAAQAGVRYSLTNPKAYMDSNMTGFFNMLEACRHHGTGHLVFASSSSVYGLNKSIPFKESHHTGHPLSLYAASKKSNEMMAHTYSGLYDIPASGLRFFTVYGPWGRPDMALFIFTRAILDGKPIRVFNFGKMKRDFTYIDDIVNGIINTAKNPPGRDNHFDPVHPDPSTSSAPYRIFNIGNSQPVDLMDFIATIEKKTGRKAQMKMEPIQPGDVPETFADTRYLENTVHYKPNTSIDYGVGKFVDWYRSYYNK